MNKTKISDRIEVLQYSIKTTTSLCTKIHLEIELQKLKDSIMKQPDNKRTDIEWTSYLACAYAEGFCEGDGATAEQQIEAWSFIAINELWKTLQGFYGRNVQSLIQQGIHEESGEINWNNFDNQIEIV